MVQSRRHMKGTYSLEIRNVTGSRQWQVALHRAISFLIPHWMTTVPPPCLSPASCSSSANHTSLTNYSYLVHAPNFHSVQHSCNKVLIMCKVMQCFQYTLIHMPAATRCTFTFSAFVRIRCEAPARVSSGPMNLRRSRTAIRLRCPDTSL